MAKLFPEILTPGWSGAAVWLLQTHLQSLKDNEGLKPTGVYDDGTVEAVMRFQSDENLEQSGNWGLEEHEAFTACYVLDLLALQSESFAEPTVGPEADPDGPTDGDLAALEAEGESTAADLVG